MLFTSLQFAVFFIIVYGVYTLLKHRQQNIMLLVASYIFYGAWDWRFLFLIFISTVFDYFFGAAIYRSNSNKQKKIFVFCSIFTNLSILVFFKYLNFFILNLQFLLRRFNLPNVIFPLHIILPLGLSFYIFQKMSYTIDIYRGEMKPVRKFSDFALFVSFFPQLLAGPIERAKHLIPQIIFPRKLTMDKFQKGCYLISWGIFQKLFVADNLSKVVDSVFSNPGPYNGLEVLLASYAFTFQIFCDFAGYSNIARGLGKLMGFDIINNFDLPFFVTNVQDFWKKWHISLSTWIKDYVYFPLFYHMRMIRGKMRIYITLVGTMILLGLWHGARWTFVLFGLYYGCLLSLYVMSKPVLCKAIKIVKFTKSRQWFWVKVIFMFHITVLGMLIFRANSVGQLIQMVHSVVFNFSIPEYSIMLRMIGKILFYISFLLLIQYFQFRRNDHFVVLKWHWALQGFIYFIIMFFLFTFGKSGGNEFVYFQF